MHVLLTGLYADLSPGHYGLADVDGAFVQGALGEGAGTAVAGAGDLDGDGRDDFWVGGPQADSDNGRIWLVPGNP